MHVGLVEVSYCSLANAHMMKLDSVEEAFPNGICHRRLVARVYMALTGRCLGEKERNTKSPASGVRKGLPGPGQSSRAIFEGLSLSSGTQKPWL